MEFTGHREFFNDIFILIDKLNLVALQNGNITGGTPKTIWHRMFRILRIVVCKRLHQDQGILIMTPYHNGGLISFLDSF